MMPEVKLRLDSLKKAERDMLDRAAAAHRNPKAKKSPDQIIREFVGDEASQFFDAIKEARRRELAEGMGSGARKMAYIQQIQESPITPEEKNDRELAWGHTIAMEAGVWAREGLPTLAERAAVEQRRWAKYANLVRDIMDSRPAPKKPKRQKK